MTISFFILKKKKKTYVTKQVTQIYNIYIYKTNKKIHDKLAIK